MVGPVEEVERPVAHLVVAEVVALGRLLAVSSDEHAAAGLRAEDVVDYAGIAQALEIELLEHLAHVPGARPEHPPLRRHEPGRVRDERHLDAELRSVGVGGAHDRIQAPLPCLLGDRASKVISDYGMVVPSVPPVPRSSDDPAAPGARPTQ